MCDHTLPCYFLVCGRVTSKKILTRAVRRKQSYIFFWPEIPSFIFVLKPIKASRVALILQKNDTWWETLRQHNSTYISFHFNITVDFSLREEKCLTPSQHVNVTFPSVPECLMVHVQTRTLVRLQSEEHNVQSNEYKYV